MTDRAALADRLEALAKKATPGKYRLSVSSYFGNAILGPEGTIAGDVTIDDAALIVALHESIPTILGALREPGFAAGAEAMREAAAEYCNSFSIAAQAMGNAPLAASLRSTADMIRLAPLPEPKP